MGMGMRESAFSVIIRVLVNMTRTTVRQSRSKDMRHCVRVLALMFAAGMIIPAMKTAAAPYRLQQKVDFIRDIQPIFQANCYACHGTGKVKTQLRLVDRSLAMSVIVAGNS